MMAESYQEKLKHVRPPRVHITFDVETGGAEPKNDLPFVVGVMGDFSGDPTKPLKALRERKFVPIDRDNFDNVMAQMNPGLNLRVDNTLIEGGGQMAVNLKFEAIEDFEPARIIEQVKPLKDLLQLRNRLQDLMSKADRSVELEEILERVLQNPGDLRSLAQELGVGGEVIETAEEGGDS
jgi:type VI secretion system protein ImpB